MKACGADHSDCSMVLIVSRSKKKRVGRLEVKDRVVRTEGRRQYQMSQDVKPDGFVYHKLVDDNTPQMSTFQAYESTR